ncbi:MAG: c-type cytochrome [Planctomycetaceae bacterium]|nr:c-type cytochrome [Planctomycetaceae bacterium]
MLIAVRGDTLHHAIVEIAEFLPRQNQAKRQRLSMKHLSALVLSLGMIWIGENLAAPAADEPTERAVAPKDVGVRPYGLSARVPWTTSRFRGTPEPPAPFRAERAFPNLSFKNPTVLTNAPGTDRLFVAEQTGKVYSIPNDPACPAADLFLDPADLVAKLREREKQDVDLEAIYGLTFHPQFVENRYCYLCYVVRYKDQQRGTHPDGTRVVRLKVTATDPPRCEPASEQLVISWLQGGHNGGCLKFGPDRCLYISTGDGAGPAPPDMLNAGQDVSNLLSAILRIDVDHPQSGRNYTIPADNPFVSLEGARGEIWAYGLRNPWKMSFDRKSGDLWVGDVGWELWEMVYRVHKGDNFGWSLYEGPQPVYTERKRGPTPIVPPTVEIPHTEGVSVTGGFVYRGKKFPELLGSYVFGDWETRRIWGVTVDGTEVGPRRELMDPSVRVVDFAEDNSGELALLDYDAGTIHTFARNPPPPPQPPFPRKLSQTGLFESVAAERVAPGVVPFTVNAPLWSDQAIAERYVAVPDDGTIRFHGQPKPIPGSMFTRRMDFPTDTVLVKTLSLEMERAKRDSRRPIETQVLHFDGRDWRGYTYEWNADKTDAELVEAAGKTKTVTIGDPEADGGRRQQTWKFASRTECLRCHNPWAENTLAFNIAQLNRDHDYGGLIDNQLRAFQHVRLLQIDETGKAADGELSQPGSEKAPHDLPRIADPFDASADLAARGRAYLHANCAHCHRDGGGGSAYVHLQYELPLAETKSIGIRPAQGTFGIHDARIIAPGDPYRSVLYFRMAKLGAGHMPHVGASMIDAQGLELVHAWIRSLESHPDETRPDEPQATLTKVAALDDKQPLAERKAKLDELLATPGRAAMLARAVQQRQVSESVRATLVAAAIEHADAAVRDLFEPFIPEEQRVKRLGEVIRPADILKLAGDAAQGRQLFHKTAGINCKSCHRIAGDGTEIGPDLSRIGMKYDRAKLLENIIEPSRNIEPQYVTWIVETTAGKVLTGILVQKDDSGIVIRDVQNQQLRIPADEVESSSTQQKSLMPDLLIRDLTAQQVADLLAYLEGLK